MLAKLATLLRYPFSLFDGEIQNNYNRPKLSEFVNINDTKRESKYFSGKVTSLNESEGVVNNDIYFNVNLIFTKCVKIGDYIQGTATKDNPNSAWRAIEIYENPGLWKETQENVGIPMRNCASNNVEESSTNIFIGKVVSIFQQLIFLHNNLSFYIDNQNCSFNICIGDWIYCKKNFSDEQSVKEDVKCIFTEVTPLRSKVIHGCITYIHSDYFIINNEVLCFKSTFKPLARPRLKVIADVIESDQFKYTWRAIKVWIDEPKKIEISQETINLFSNLEKSSLIKEEAKNQTLKNVCTKEIPINGEISIKGQFSIQLNGVGFSDYLKITLKNESLNSSYVLERISFHSEISDGSQLGYDPFLRLPLKLNPSVEFFLILHCIGKYLGLSKEIIKFNFGNDFVVTRVITIIVQNNYVEVSKFNRSLGPLKGRIIKGEKPCHASPFIPVKLPQAVVPDHLWEAILKQNEINDVVPVLRDPLLPENYVKKLSILLFLEEIEMEMQMRKFDIPCTNFYHIGEYLALKVTGLAENRPSLMIGDSVIVSSPGTFNDDIKFEGVIHKVLKAEVLLKFHPNFHSNYYDEGYSVQLRFNRTPLRRCHLATSLILEQLGSSVLFPSRLVYQLPQVVLLDEDIIQDFHYDINKNDDLCYSKDRQEKEPNFMGGENLSKSFGLSRKINPSLKVDCEGCCTPVLKESSIQYKDQPQRAERLKWFNNSLNCEQKTAVRRILEGSTRPLPYIIYGPPGTGKTVTLVEAILQIYTKVPSSRILIVSPSNSASDLVALRAVGSGKLRPGELVRINAFNRSLHNIPEKLEEYCTTGNNLKDYLRHRIIVSTSTTAGLFYSVKLKYGHFTHVFIDEAGQLTEPETSVSLGLINSSCGQIVLAGDPKQLGPVVLSPLARKYGLGQSLLHRLCSSVIYQPVDPVLKSIYSESDPSVNEVPTLRFSDNRQCYYEPSLVTLLVKNYRSHPDLLRVPSSLFYQSLLVPSTEQTKNQFLNWDELPNPECPLIFHGVKGENLQEGDSPSWFNPSEAFQVSHYVISLLNFGVTSSEIGVIAPYKKQGEKIRKLLNSFGIEERIKVGPVEEFQGQERLAIIVSTVRSSENTVEADILHNLGFIRCEQRFNVAITRAMGVLIVVGDPILLGQDPNWNSFLTYCISKNAVRNFCPK